MNGLKLYQIYGSAYNGCSGWEEWACENKIYKDKTIAETIAKEMGNCFEVKEIDVED